MNFSGDPAFEQSFLDAAAFWVSLLPSYLDGRRYATEFTGLTIDADIAWIDGVGDTLGSAGPTTGRWDDSGFLLATHSTMTFDSADFGSPGPIFDQVVLHEMAHAIGFGTMWTYTDLYDPGLPSVTDPLTGEPVGRYFGASGLAGWRSEFDPDATFVPVEKGGGSGTEDSHWNQIDSSSEPTGYVSSSNGQDAVHELMTGWLHPDVFVSDATLGSFRDLGYHVPSVAIPESKAMLLVMASFSFLLFRRRRG